MSEFDDVLAQAPVSVLDGPATGDAGEAARSENPDRREATGSYDAGWVIGNAVNGGVVMASALAALGTHLADDPAETTQHVDPVAISAYFMTASTPGGYRAGTEVIRTGRTLSTGQITITQDDDGRPRERMRALASFGNLGDLELDRQPEAPDIPAPDECVSIADAGPGMHIPPIMHRLDLRLDPATADWAVGKPSRRARMRGWLRMADGREPDTLLLMAALDFMPPVAFDLGFIGWAPTLEFTGYVRRRPGPGWLLVELSSDTLGGGFMEEDARIWDSSGTLVAQSRQLCSVRPPT